MNGFMDLLNQNQGVLAAVAITITIAGGVITWFLRKNKSVSSHRNSPYIKTGHGVFAGGDIIVGGSKTQLVNENIPTVVIKPDSFTHNTGRFDLLFENTGQSTAIIQGLRIGENNVNIDEFSLSPGQQIRKQINVSGFKILEEKLGGPNFELLYKDFSNNKKYKTIGNIRQESRADGKYNLGKINNISFLSVNLNTAISNLERRVLEKLYSDYKKTGRKIKWKAIDAFKILNIKDGEDISTLHNSKFINIELDGTHECFMITPEGIRYMDNR